MVKKTTVRSSRSKTKTSAPSARAAKRKPQPRRRKKADRLALSFGLADATRVVTEAVRVGRETFVRVRRFLGPSGPISLVVAAAGAGIGALLAVRSWNDRGARRRSGGGVMRRGMANAAGRLATSDSVAAAARFANAVIAHVIVSAEHALERGRRLSAGT